jgi:L-alanine-DL-glutamate epimerase-like enolase superfamily enzyme
VLRLKTDAGITGWATMPFGTMEGGPLVLQSILQSEVRQVLWDRIQLRMVDSAVLAPQNPGMGTELRPEHLQKHKV